MNFDFSKYTDVAVNEKLAQNIQNDGNYKSQVLTHFNGKIFACDPRDGYIDESTWLVDVGKLYNIGQAVAAGGAHEGDTSLYEKNQNSIFSQNYQNIIEEAKKQKAKIDANPGIPPHRILGAAGNTIETAFETVRRVNYITDIVGPQYVPTDYNAINGVNVRNVKDLNFKGFVKSSSLLQGQGRIGDHKTPDVARQAFTAFETSLFADSFRYEFTMREKKDSVPNLESEIRAEIPGLMARLVDDRLTTLMNAVTDAGAISPDWDATSGNFFTGDAAGDIEGDEEALDTYRSPLVAFMPRAVYRLYKKNVQAAISAEPSKSVSSTQPGRTGTLGANPAVKYYINASIDSAAYVVIAKNAWHDFFRGPTMNISYKNQMTPGQVEGRIVFAFNSEVQKIAAAARYHSSVT